MELLHRLDILLRCLVNVVVGIVQLVVLEISCGTGVMSVSRATLFRLCILTS